MTSIDGHDGNVLPSPGALILIGLAGGDKHGYALAKDIKDFAGVDLTAGTLYGALARLEEDRLIAPLAADERRRPYRLTASGRTALNENLEEIAQIASTGLRRLNRHPTTS